MTNSMQHDASIAAVDRSTAHLPPPPAATRRSILRRIAGHPLSHLCAALLVVALLQTLIVKVYQVPSASMSETLLPGDRLLVNRVTYLGAPPSDGDVVVFHRPSGWGDATPEQSVLRTIAGWFGDVFGFGPSNEHALVKRIIGEPGQTVECCDDEGRVQRNGVAIDEPYLGSNPPFVSGQLDCTTQPQSLRCFAPIVLPPNRYLMLGDNRAASSDSIAACRGVEQEDSQACVRLVAREDIVGSVFFVAFPIARWGQAIAGTGE